jgi:uncharacterized protein DUF3891
MIVRQNGNRVQLISQPDHARLARRIMERDVSLAIHPRVEVILRAIAAHDNGWADFDAALTVDPASGKIVDFVHVPVSVRQTAVPRSVSLLADEPWAAALVAQHALTVYDRFRSDAEWARYFAEMTETRGELLRVTGISLDELLADYAYLRLADLISLAFCTASIDDLRYSDWTVRLSGSRVAVTPDVFGGAEIPIEIAALEIPSRPYRSDVDLRNALSEATSATLLGSVVGQEQLAK